MCEVLGISERTYYKYRAAQDKDYYDYLLIKEIFDESKGTYGYRRICEGLLIKYGVIFNHKKTARIMKKYGLKPEYIKRIRPNTFYKRIEKNVKPNLLKRNFKVPSPNTVWVTDITYLSFGNKRAYLSTILDLHDRKIVAHQISKRNDIKLVIDTLKIKQLLKRRTYQTLSFTVIKVFNIRPSSTKPYANPMGFKYQ